MAQPLTDEERAAIAAFPEDQVVKCPPFKRTPNPIFSGDYRKARLEMAARARRLAAAKKKARQEGRL